MDYSFVITQLNRFPRSREYLNQMVPIEEAKFLRDNYTELHYFKTILETMPDSRVSLLEQVSRNELSQKSRQLHNIVYMEQCTRRQRQRTTYKLRENIRKGKFYDIYR